MLLYTPLSQESREVVVYRLLDQAVAAELVSATIQRKVAPYVKRHALNLDAVLLDYIKVSQDCLHNT